MLELPAYAVLVVVFYLFLKGYIVSRAQLEAVQKVADTFQRAWEASEKGKQENTQALNELLVGMRTVQKILESAGSDET